MNRPIALLLASLASQGCKAPRPVTEDAGAAESSRAASERTSGREACVPDPCSLATMRAMAGSELRVAESGVAKAAREEVRALAVRIADDARADLADLDALEERLAVRERLCPRGSEASAAVEAAGAAGGGTFDEAFVHSEVALLEARVRIINEELIGCAANGDLKTSLRFERARGAEAGAPRGLAPDLEALRALSPATPAGSRETLASRPPFVHPGIFVTRAQLDFVRERVAEHAEPWSSALRRALADRHARPDYAPHPPLGRASTETTPATRDGIVLCGSFSDPDVHCSDEKEDAVAAYTQALIGYLRGDDRATEKAIAILDAWEGLDEHRLFNAALQAAWTGTIFARAAELAQASPLWPPERARRFKRMMRRAFVPVLTSAIPGAAIPGDPSYGQNGNWVLSVADALVQIGVLLDDRDLFDTGVRLWRRRVPAYCYLSSIDGMHPEVPEGEYAGSNAGYAAPATRTGDPYGYWGQAGNAGARHLADGTSQETCRDLEHVQFGLAAITNAAETARIQGVDLYREEGERLAACMELAALYENDAPATPSGAALAYPTPVSPAVVVPAQEPTLCPDAKGRAAVTLLNTGSLASFAVQPTWEAGYNALANRLGLPLPETRKLVLRYRSAPADWPGATHHIAWETLTHGDVDRAATANAERAR